MHVKTNVVGLALLNLNAGVEFDLGNYLSVNVPISYSAVDCYKSTVKFRNFSLQPELRYWPMKNFDGLYIGAHLGFAYYENGKLCLLHASSGKGNVIKDTTPLRDYLAKNKRHTGIRVFRPVF